MNNPRVWLRVDGRPLLGKTSSVFLCIERKRSEVTPLHLSWYTVSVRGKTYCHSVFFPIVFSSSRTFLFDYHEIKGLLTDHLYAFCFYWSQLKQPLPQYKSKRKWVELLWNKKASRKTQVVLPKRWVRLKERQKCYSCQYFLKCTVVYPTMEVRAFSLCCWCLSVASLCLYPFKQILIVLIC